MTLTSERRPPVVAAGILACNGVEPRVFKIPLAFLDAGKNYRLELFWDDPTVDTTTRVRSETNVVDRAFLFQRRVSAHHGLAAILTPAE